MKFFKKDRTSADKNFVYNFSKSVLIYVYTLFIRTNVPHFFALVYKLLH